jgi:hypothetical protein
VEGALQETGQGASKQAKLIGKNLCLKSQPSNIQCSVPSFVRLTPALIFLENAKVSHRFVENKPFLVQVGIADLVHREPGAGIEIHLIERSAVFDRRTERSHGKLVGVTINSEARVFVRDDQSGS